MQKLIDGLDIIPENALLAINLAMAAFVLLAHGGSLALTLYEDGEISLMVMINVPLAILLILSSILGFISKQLRMKILSIHSLVLIAGSLLTFYYGLSLLFAGFPKGNFSWGIGFFTFFCVYPVYLLRRTILKSYIENSSIVKYSHIIIFIIAILIDISVFTKAASHYRNYQREFIEKHRVK